MLVFVKKIILSVGIVALLSACVSSNYRPLPVPSEVVYQQPIQDSSGKFVSPYTSDDVLAEWVDKAVNAEMGSTIGATAGIYAGQKVFEQIPFVGSYIGSAVGDYAGRAVAIEMSGGEEFIRKTSDLSFNNVNDLAVWLYAKHSSNKHYSDALEATYAIYPELKENYMEALYAAQTK